VIAHHFGRLALRAHRATGWAPLAALATSLGCGKERWDVKTLTDGAAGQVNLTPLPAGVAQLGAIVPPPPDPPVRQPEECVTYKVAGTITLAKQEADSDIHMVLDDGLGHTMVVEAACPECAAGSLVLDQITAVRAAVQAQFPAAFQGVVMRGLSVPATVTGVFFADRIHGQDGVAPNGGELHPIIAIDFSGGN
jgi:hypothetical protein